MELANYKSKIKEHGLVLLLFVVLTLIWTYPVVTGLTDHAAGHGVDGFVFKWNIWHVNRALTGGGGITELYYSDLSLYPHGASLEWQTLSLTNTLFIASFLGSMTDNLVFIYNILFLFNFVMAGYTMYLLVKYLVKDRAIAFLVGFAYTFSPLHMSWAEAGFLNLASFLWIPLFLLFFFKMFEEEKIRNAIIAAIVLFFLALASWYHLLFAFLIAAPYFIYKFIRSPHLFTRQLFIRAALLLFLFSIIISPFLLPLIFVYFRGETVFNEPIDHGLALFHYFLPSTLHPLWGHSVADLRGGELFPGPARILLTVTPGYLVILISLLYVVKTKKNLFWFLLVVFFALISVNFQGIAGALLGYIPFINTVATNLFSFMVLFPFLLLFAFALGHFLSGWKHKSKGFALVAALFFVLALEYLGPPYGFGFPTTSFPRHGRLVIESAEEVGQAVRGPHPVLGNDFTVLDVPPRYTSLQYTEQHDFYFQTFHEKPIIGGRPGRSGRPTQLQTLQEYERIFHANDIKDFQRFLEEYRVGYIIYSIISPEYEKRLVREGNPTLSLYSTMLQQISGRLIFATDISHKTTPQGVLIYEVWLEKYFDANN